MAEFIYHADRVFTDHLILDLLNLAELPDKRACTKMFIPDSTIDTAFA